MFDSPHPAIPRQCVPARVVALPGTGSDADFARRAFGSAAAERGLRFRAVEPDPRDVVAGYRAALDEAAEDGPVLVAGISLGAAVAVEWAAARSERAASAAAVAGVVAALPAWTGPDTTGCPAALSAAYTAARLRADGLEAVIEQMRAGSPGWLGAALTQSWRSQWPWLPGALEEAAAYAWPDAERLAALNVPVAVIATTDDPVHPLAVGERWAALIPGATLDCLTLDELGADPSVLGHRGFAALSRVLPPIAAPVASEAAPVG
ncbi:alpha/beta fold hydrolase [Nocardia shimofusensis]|uniref:alpha/beta fold hydrolase n=1 Tax=Nocardia shimofusensis TaxID=228596 RepID=UPI00082E35CE|nr:alpha/beta fold hydrolase [Nocardia shimofusensis]